jgi:hypothetical protein
MVTESRAGLESVRRVRSRLWNLGGVQVQISWTTMKPSNGTEPKLARNWSISSVQRCLDSDDKDSLLAFINQRYRERFFSPIQRLMDSPGQLDGYGFAIMALCSLLIESLQCYRYGLPTDLPSFSHPFITGVFWVWFCFEICVSQPSSGLWGCGKRTLLSTSP